LRKALLYERLRGDRVRCRLCCRTCVIPEGERGFCRSRINIGGDLYTLTYGNLSAAESRPIEIKPFFHYWPGSTAMTISTWSCNFTCPWCQNWGLSSRRPDDVPWEEVPPEAVVQWAVEGGDEGLCISFNEPTLLFEFSLDVFRLGRRAGLYACYVSNGYMSSEALRMLVDAGLTGLKVDVKGGRDAYREILAADWNVVWSRAEEALRMGVHVEVVFLMVSGIGDREEVVEEVISEHLKRLGEEVPLHFTRYFPAYRYGRPPTGIEALEKAYLKARREGVKFPYIGNVSGHWGEHTYCPRCGRVLVKRRGVRVVSYRVTGDGKCPYCGEAVPVAGRPVLKH